MHRNRLLLVMLVALPGGAYACGWWGDAEHQGAGEVQAVDATGAPVVVEDPMRDPDLMVRYGDRFRTGRAGPRDLNLAHHWYRLAAERGHPGGQYNLGLMHEFGLGVRRDEAAALSWYRRAAEQGDVHAQHHLGRLLVDGRGTPADPARGLAWLERAARQGHDEVFVTVAEAYAEGHGVRRDPAAAYLWYALAAARGDARARQPMEGLAGQLDATALALAQGEARALMASWVTARPGTGHDR